jgi:hypothetical protein
MLSRSVSVARLAVALLLVLGFSLESVGAWAQAKPSTPFSRPSVLPKELIGSWRLDKDDDAPNKTPPNEVITFSADGTWKVTSDKEPIGGRCRVEGEEVVMLMIVENNTRSRRRRFKLDAEGLHFANPDGGYAHYVKVK